MTVNKNKLENYAKLAVEFGVNVQKNEDVLINSSLEDPALARLIAKYAYKNNLTLKQACHELKYLSDEEFDEIVKPEKMV